MTAHTPRDCGMKNVAARLAKARVRVKDPALLRSALTHSSYLNQKGRHCGPSYQRLEFLGDAVLSLLVAEELYRRYPDAEEGWLTRTRAQLVREDTIAAAARKLGLGDAALVGKGEEQAGIRNLPSVLSDLFEALLGALYLDGGLEAARSVVTYCIPFGKVKSTDYKTALQEMFQRKYKEEVEYVLLDSWGPAHDRTFRSAAVYKGEVLGTGEGRSKKQSEQAAAKDALERLEAADQANDAGDERGGL